MMNIPLNHIRCRRCCIRSDVSVIRTQHERPRRSGFPPVFTSFTISVLSPIAAIARMIMNFESVLKGAKKSPLTPALIAIVVMTDAAMNQIMKNGKIFLIETFLPFPPLFPVLMNARTSVIGMMASVLVSFTVTALSRVAVPRFHMLSHVEAQAVTDDVSFTAVQRVHHDNEDREDDGGKDIEEEYDAD